MEFKTEVEIDFSVWLSTNYEAAKGLYDARKITWEVLVELLRRAHSSGVGFGIERTIEQLDKIEAERNQQS